MNSLPPAVTSALALAILVATTPAPAQQAQNPLSNKASNIGQHDTTNTIAPALPQPKIGPNAGPFAYLRAARVALATGKTGEAQQALEMAETRMLDRSVPLFQTTDPSQNGLVHRVGDARRALGAGDLSRAMSDIDAALAMDASH